MKPAVTKPSNENIVIFKVTPNLSFAPMWGGRVYPLSKFKIMATPLASHSGLAGGHYEFSIFIKNAKFNSHRLNLHLTRIYLEF